MRLIPGNAQHIGSRGEQQDDFGFSDMEDSEFMGHGGVLMVLTDGMGGLSMGREASRTAKMTMLSEYAAKAVDESITAALDRGLQAANLAVYEMAREEGLEGEVGTTLVAAAVREEQLYWVSVGDSRIYLYRDGSMTQLSTDHIFARELDAKVARGEISREEAESDPHRHALTSGLGWAELKEIDWSFRPIPVEAGDRIMLCSDGVYNALADEEIADALGGDPQDASENLIQKALAKGRRNQDNMAVAILACEPDVPTTMATRRKRSAGALNRMALATIVLMLAGAVTLVFLYPQHDRYLGNRESPALPSVQAPMELPTQTPGQMPATDELPRSAKETSPGSKQEEEPFAGNIPIPGDVKTGTEENRVAPRDLEPKTMEDNSSAVGKNDKESSQPTIPEVESKERGGRRALPSPDESEGRKPGKPLPDKSIEWRSHATSGKENTESIDVPSPSDAPGDKVQGKGGQ